MTARLRPIFILQLKISRCMVSLTTSGSTATLYNAVQLLRGGAQPAGGGGGDDERVLPAYYSQNYFTLLPGEERELRVRFTCGAPGTAACEAGTALGLEVHGWNSAPIIARVHITLA